MSAQSPAFQFYFKDWRSSRKVQRMSFAQRGMYLELLIDLWDQGPLPLDPKAIAEQIGAKEADFVKSWPALRLCFQETPDGWVNARLEQERSKQESRRQRASEWGKDGAAKKWGKPSGQNGHPIGSPSKPDSFSISLASSGAIASALADASEMGSADKRNERAGRLLQELYPAWYAKYRHGARLRLMANALAFQEALSIVQLWDDARIEKLAQIVLTTDDPFISGTDRSFKIFAMKASWADDRLRQAESGAA